MIMKNIHVLPTDKPTILFVNNEKLLLAIGFAVGTKKNKGQNIYITSDEYIGLSYYLDGNLVRKGVVDDKDYWEVRKDYKKIILTTDQDLIKDGVQAIDDEFLEWFVKNQACENVYVHKEYKQINQDNPITVGSTTLVFSHYETVIPKEEPKDVLLGYKTSLVAQMLDSKEISEEPIEETLEDAAEKFVNNTRLQNRKVLFMEGAKWQQEQILNFLYEEITERRPYSASKMCEKVIEFIKKNDR